MQKLNYGLKMLWGILLVIAAGMMGCIDKATIVTNKISPQIEVKFHREKTTEKFPLVSLDRVFVVGKPRLLKPLKKWGVNTYYSSTKGIKNEADPIIEQTLDLPSIRIEFQKIFLQSLLFHNLLP